MISCSGRAVTERETLWTRDLISPSAEALAKVEGLMRFPACRGE
jgi:hypothetical protein